MGPKGVAEVQAQAHRGEEALHHKPGEEVGLEEGVGLRALGKEDLGVQAGVQPQGAKGQEGASLEVKAPVRSVAQAQGVLRVGGGLGQGEA